MKHLVLGSSGQIGKYLVKHLTDKNQSVIEWDIANGLQYDLRIADNPLLKSALDECDYVHFLAFEVGGSTWLAKHQQTYAFLDDNMRLMKNTFNAIRVSGKPFYFTSSQMSNMYDSTYGRLKAVGEAYTKALGGLNVHFWNVYGYELDPNKTHVITDFIKMALTEGRIIIKTNGEEERSFMHASDAADVLYRISHNHDDLCELGLDALPVTTDRWKSILSIAEDIARLVGNVKIYRGLNVDTTQTIRNEPDRWARHDFLVAIDIKPMHFIDTDQGIEMIIEQMKEPK